MILRFFGNGIDLELEFWKQSGIGNDEKEFIPTLVIAILTDEGLCVYTFY